MPTSAPSIIAAQHRMEKPILKRIPYRGSEPAYDGIIDYVIMDGNRCIYSGITRNSTSTINAAENIIHAICRREEFEPNEVEFFELRTCQGYGDLHLERYQFFPMVLEFDDRENVKDVGWNACIECPSDIREIFKDHIGTFTVPQLTWDEAVAQGFGGKENYCDSSETAEKALYWLRMDNIGKPGDTHTYAIVDLATNPAATIENGRRYQTRVKFTNPEEVRESRYEMKSMAETRQRIVQYKNHELTPEELTELAELFHYHLACNGKPPSPLRHSMEMLMRVYVCILHGDDTPDHLLGCFLPGAEGIIANLCDTMPGFHEHAMARGARNSGPLESAIAAIAKENPYTGDEPPFTSTLIH